ncbi:protein transport protein SEC61 subunit gamma [Methanobrevibacter gottschalkii]|uniref:Protein translocase subunit SecE n=2 Tax=Methanobrevibacter gottschalkii TaxID=190974 RepID=A0A3N5B6N9_9EURY|nr:MULTISPECIES: protein translocase SEC61 complex subunit gamma [Methanobrevibacter]MCQ2970351.1 protein translocase SEC61 complex subunit gamma [archaeon]OEC95187.1 protein translocase SEC61 complex subunit gamma [Methanobrevibacter sp. A27]RPF53094.1 protein translocase subunit secE/sec61 gamma [Methanobrevibacter gottschalkii DSM 11977]SEK60171.1 protein transport protein SEC61 subunit gamma [Methanobrevibacter gottschalkii]
MNVQENFNKFIKDSKRVLKVAKKPDGAEYRELAKISVLGVAVIGVVGFVIVLLGSLIGL